MLHTFYAGQIFADVDVPWHYPLVMLAVTLPAGVLLLFVMGLSQIRRRLDDPGFMIHLVGLAFLLSVFSFPGVPVYDGVRLFLAAVPLASVFAAGGAQQIAQLAVVQRVASPWRMSLVVVFLVSQLWGVVAYHPYQLSHYSGLVGGLSGANRLGFEVNYWGDCLTGTAATAAAGRATRSRVAATEAMTPLLFAPNLTPFHAAAIGLACPPLAADDVELAGYDPANRESEIAAEYALVFNRRAEGQQVSPLVSDAAVEYELAHDGVWLVRLYRLAKQDTPADASDRVEP